jgi:hypothetical protein
MPKCSAGVLAHINNFVNNTCPAKKLHASNKENDGSLSSLWNLVERAIALHGMYESHFDKIP